MDAGAYLNIPYLPLMRRECDVIIAIDASADSQVSVTSCCARACLQQCGQDLWFTRAEEYATKRQIKRWPHINVKGIFPPHPAATAEPKSSAEQNKDDDNSAASRVVDEAQRQADDRKGHLSDASKAETSATQVPSKSSSDETPEPPLGRVNIWIGSDKEDTGASRMDEVSEDEVAARDGLALVYIPLSPGEGLDDPAETWSTWKCVRFLPFRLAPLLLFDHTIHRFEYTPEQTQQLSHLAEVCLA